MFSDVLFIEHDFISVVAIAQLVEPRIVIPVVVGSSPISHPILISINTKALSIILFRVQFCYKTSQVNSIAFS